MLEQIYNSINYHTAFLYKVIYQNDYFFFDFWSINHILSGFLIMLFIIKKKYPNPFGMLLILLFAWEAVEMSFIFFAVNVFRPEILPDQITDIVVGLAGGATAWYYLKYRRKHYVNGQLRHRAISFIDISVSCIVSFYWVGYYGYKYNIYYLNSPIINWLAFSLWSSGLLCTIMLYKLIGWAIEHKWYAMFLTWLSYFTLLLLIEFIGYYVLGIRQITEEKPLIFGLIHGTTTLKVYYIIAGISTIALSKFFKKILEMIELPNNQPEKKNIFGR